jgi:hypothetical protein
MSTDPTEVLPTATKMLAIIAERCCSYMLSVNEKRLVYEDVQPEEVWEFVVHWRTPVVSDVYTGPDLEYLIIQVYRDAEDREPWKPIQPRIGTEHPDQESAAALDRMLGPTVGEEP